MSRFEKSLISVMNKIADFVGRPMLFLAVIVLVLIWFACSRLLEYQVWFDIMDVTIFVSTFFMLFILQASQNADTQAMQHKLDEIIEALPNASTKVEGEEKEYKRGEKDPDSA